LIDRILWRWGLTNPGVTPRPKSTAKPHPKTPLPAASMKTPPIKTFGTGLEKIDVFGAIPLSQEDVERSQTEARTENLKHERELRTPIKSFKVAQAEFGCGGSMGVTSPAIARAVADWDAKQKALFAPFKVPEITSTSPIKTLHN
jgi:hypothetical protein